MSNRRLTLPITIIALLGLLGSFVGLKNETRTRVTTPMSFFKLRALSRVVGGGGTIVDVMEPSSRCNSSVVFEVSAGANNTGNSLVQPNNDERTHAQDCPKSWGCYVESYRRYANDPSEQSTPGGTDGMDFNLTTSQNFTRITIFNEKASYHLCDLLLVKIQARDWNDRPKPYGGDFFRLKIYHREPYSAASEDEIIDFRNGTYLALFTLRWAGEVKVQVELIHPAELLPLLETALSGKFGLNMTFVGEFVSGNITEGVQCRYVELPAPMCNFSNPRTHGPWFCQKPQNPNLTCDDWRWHKRYYGSFLKTFERQISPLSRMLFGKSHKVDVENNCSFKVVPKYMTIDTDQPSIPSALPHCGMDGLPSGLHASGHFFAGSWYPDSCTVVKHVPGTGMECMRNRTIVLLGDSTIRQIYDALLKQYKRYLKPLPLQRGVWPGFGPRIMRSTQYNASVHFHFHGLPSHGVDLTARRDYIEFVADRLDSGRDGCAAVYVISLWAHFLISGRDFYVQRMLAIRRAITDYLDRCPGAKVIIKGGNTREVSRTFNPVHSTEWIVAKLEFALREVFREEKRVGFIDALDMTKAQPYADKTHPNPRIVEEYVDKILTYICKN